VLKTLNLGGNQLCGLDRFGRGTYSAAGITALAEALKVNEVLKKLDARYNAISGDAAQQLAAAVIDSPSLELFGSVPLKELRANTLDRLDLRDESLGVPEALVLAKLVEGSAVLKTLNPTSTRLASRARRRSARPSRLTGS